MFTQRFRIAFALSLGSGLLAACAGGGGDPAPAPPAVTISGRILGATVEGVTVSLTGPATATATTDATGAYAFAGLSAVGTYALTPQKSGYVFSPPTFSVTVGAETSHGIAPDARASACSVDGWCWENPVPQGNSLRAAWTRTASDAWAVGSGGTILRWDGAGWSKHASGTTVDLYGVWAASADDAWAVGWSFAGDRNRAVVLRWDGRAWSTATGVDTFQLVAVWGSAPDDVWAAGSGLWHWDGSAWSLAAGGLRANAIWGSSGSDVWAVGDGGSAAHWDGSAWSSVASGVAARYDALFGLTVTPNLLAAWGSGADDVWAAGTHGTVVHWDGLAWADTTRGTCAALQDACSGALDARCGSSGLCCDATCSAVGAYEYRALCGGAGGDVWMLDGYTDQSGTALRWDGTGWTRVPTGKVENLLGGSAVPGIEPWFVGARGELVRWDGAAWRTGWRGATHEQLHDVWAVGSGGTILHRDESGWSSVSNPRSGVSSANLMAVWGTSASDVWVVGNESTILHWDGSTWASVANPLGSVAGSATLEGVWGSSPDDVWAVGTGIVRWDGLAWTVVRPDGAGSFTGVWGSAPDDVWAVGTWPTGTGSPVSGIVHWDGNAWSSVFTGPRLGAIWGSGPADVWAVGEEGAIAHWDGQAWTAVPSGVTTRLGAVWGSSTSDVWAGGRGVLLHWNGGGWSPVSSGTTEYGLEGFWGSSADEVLAVGEFGTILRYRP